MQALFSYFTCIMALITEVPNTVSGKMLCHTCHLNNPATRFESTGAIGRLATPGKHP